MLKAKIMIKPAFSSAYRNAKGAGMANVMYANHQRYVERKMRNTVRGAAAYARKIMKNKIKPGSTSTRKSTNMIPVRYRNSEGEWRTGWKHQTVRTRSKAPNPPRSHVKGKKWGIRSIEFDRFRGSDFVYHIGPLKFKSKDAWKSKFSIHSMLATGGGGLLRMKINNNDALSTNDRYKGRMKPTEFRFIRVNYPARPYTSVAIEPTRKKFPSLYYSG
tara:strand:+ start:2525 stop:3175 length:651 start_codon:yes stop_codon:yes gene_type:complete